MQWMFRIWSVLFLWALLWCRYCITVLNVTGKNNERVKFECFLFIFLKLDMCTISVTNNHVYVPFVVIIIRSFPHSWFIPVFLAIVTRRVPHVEQELLTLPKYHKSPSVFSRVRDARSSVFVCWWLFVLFVWSIALSVLWSTASDYPFAIFKLFFMHKFNSLIKYQINF